MQKITKIILCHLVVVNSDLYILSMTVFLFVEFKFLAGFQKQELHYIRQIESYIADMHLNSRKFFDVTNGKENYYCLVWATITRKESLH